MKRVAQFAAVAAVAALALTACSDAPDKTSPSGGAGTAAADFKACMVSDFGGFNDNSFNESGFNGLKKAESDLGVQTATAESTDAGQYTSNVDSMVQSNCSLIVTVGFNLADATAAAADAEPKQNFALIDSGVDPVRDNVKPLLFNTQEAAFLAGYLAAGMTKTGTVATFGGQPYPSVTIFMDGFVDGVARYNEDNSATVKVLGWDKATQKGSFSETFDDKGVGTSLTDGFISSGADIILPVAGPVGEGALASAIKHPGVNVIWVDSDGYLQTGLAQYKGIILTSVMKEISTAVFDVIKSTSEGAFSADPYVGTLANGGIGLAPFHDLEASVPKELQTKIDDLEKQIIAGTLVVESVSATPVK